MPAKPGLSRARWAWLTGGASIALVAATALGWWLGWLGRAEDPRVTTIKSLQQELAAKYPPDQGPQNVAEAAERVAAITTVMTRIAALPEELRPQAMEPGRRIMMRSMEVKIDGYFALPPQERDAYLDGEIRQMEFMRKAFEAGQSVMNAVGLGGKPGESNAGGGPPWMRAGSEADRNAWRKRMLDGTSPEQRAKFGEYFSAMQRRREKLGLPPMGPR
jgi:hypothetical protein